MPDGPTPDDQHRSELQDTDPGAPGTRRAEQIGPYRLLEKLGEGGMGQVWLAEQQEPVKRKVALKVIKQGMDTKQVVARFDAEKQALALMDHPAIATVYNLACFEAVRGDRAKAMDWLRRSIEAGWASADWMPQDTDLETLHGPEFDALVERARRNAIDQQAR